MKNTLITLVNLLVLTGCTGMNQAQQPLRPGIYGPVIDTLVVPEEKMVSRGRLSPPVREEIMLSKTKAASDGVTLHIICPESATQSVMGEMTRLGLSYDRNINLHKGYLIMLSKKDKK